MTIVDIKDQEDIHKMIRIVNHQTALKIFLILSFLIITNKYLNLSISLLVTQIPQTLFKRFTRLKRRCFNNHVSFDFKIFAMISMYYTFRLF